MTSPAGVAAAEQRLAAGGRLPFVGWLRVVAIAAVVLIHASGPVVVRDDLRGTPVWYAAAVFNGGTRWCVPLFIVVSGALLLQPRPMAAGIGGFYRRRMVRLLPALVFWQVAYLVFRVVVRGQSLTVTGVVRDVLTGNVYTAMYFFWLILGLYLVAPFLWRVVDGLPERTWLWLGAGLVAAASAWLTTMTWLAENFEAVRQGTATVWTLWIPYVGFFVLGGALARREASRREGLWGLAVFVVATSITVLERGGYGPDWVRTVSPPGYSSWLVAASTVGLWLAATWFCREGTFLARGRTGALGERLGALTLGVFGVHLMVLYYLSRWLTPGLADGSVRLPAFVVMVAGTLVASWAVAWAMSKVPVLRRVV